MKHRSVTVTHYGGPDVLKLVELDDADPRPGEVRVKVLAAGVALPDIMMREGIHPETPRLPFTPGWDLVGIVDRLGKGVTSIKPGSIVAALPIHGAYTESICMPEEEFVPVPPGIDPADAVSLILNYVTAYQMLHRSAKVKPGQRVLIHGAAGGVGSALMQLGRLCGLEMYGTCSAEGASAVRKLGGVPIDYRNQDFVEEICRYTGVGVDAVFDGIGGPHMWRSRSALRSPGIVVVYGLTGSLNSGRLASGSSGRRNRLHGMGLYGLYILGSWLLPGRRRLVPYSIQWLKRVKPWLFRQDLTTLFDLLQRKKIKPLIAHRFSLAQAKEAQKLLGTGGVVGKIVILANEQTAAAA